jgi:hypothetical protein
VTVQLRPPRLARPSRHGCRPRFQPNDRASAAPLLSCPDGSDGKLDSRLACAHARAGSTNAMCGRICQCGAAMRLRARHPSATWAPRKRPRVELLAYQTPGSWCEPQPLDGRIVAKWNHFGISMNQIFLERGGRGFISLERGRPATAPTLMRRVFLGPASFEFFSKNQTIKRRRRPFVQAKQCSPGIRAMASGHLFSRRGQAEKPSEKLSRNSRGGGGVRHDRFFERAK